MKSTSRRVIGTICAIITGIVLSAGTFTSTAVAKETNSIDYITSMAKANKGTLFMVGNEGEISNVSATDIVKAAIAAEIITTDIYARNNKEITVSDATKMEFINQFGYSDGQTITVYEDNVTSEAKIIFEREYDNAKHYCIYTFDKVYDYIDEFNSANGAVETFNYKGFRYAIFVQDDRFCLAKKWDPEPGTHVYEIDEARSSAVRKLQQAFSEGKDITFIQENGENAPVHAFLTNGVQKEEFVFYNLGETALGAPICLGDDGELIMAGAREVITAIDTIDGTYTIFEENGLVYIGFTKNNK